MIVLIFVLITRNIQVRYTAAQTDARLTDRVSGRREEMSLKTKMARASIRLAPDWSKLPASTDNRKYRAITFKTNPRFIVVQKKMI